MDPPCPRLIPAGSAARPNRTATHSQGDVAQNYEQRGQERASNDVSEPVETKIQPADGNDQHTGNHQRCEQGPQSTAPSDPVHTAMIPSSAPVPATCPDGNGW